VNTKSLRLFLDSNVLIGGIVARWGLDKAVLSLCAAKICRLVLAEAVREEVEENLLLHAAALPAQEASAILDDYAGLLRMTAPEIIPYPDEATVLASRRLIAHEADVPVLLSALAAKPDWLLTHNIEHFNAQVAKRTGLQIATPSRFFRTLAEGITPTS
jgi:predicted nucleic acid-binding protein